MSGPARQDVPLSRRAVLSLTPASYRRLLIDRLRLLRLRHCSRSLWFAEFNRACAIVRSGS